MNSEVDILTGKIQERKTAEQSVLNHKIEAVQLAAEKEKEMIQVRKTFRFYLVTIDCALMILTVCCILCRRNMRTRCML